jgi:uncharacterized protein YqjF (DUF2071 family)
VNIAFLKSFMSQNWEDLLLLHWPVCPEELSPTIPKDLELDLFEGQAWASVVGFRLTNLRISALRVIPWSDFLEVNLRTYVKDREGRRGVWFHSLDSSDLTAVLGARALYGLAYFHSVIEIEKTREALSFRSSRRRFWGDRRASLGAKFPIEGKELPLAESSLDRFLLERYRFWARRKLSSSSSSVVVKHRPYDAHLVKEAHYAGGLFEASGMNEPISGPAVAHYCKGFSVSASAPSWAFGTFGQANQR